MFALAVGPENSLGIAAAAVAPATTPAQSTRAPERRGKEIYKVFIFNTLQWLRKTIPYILVLSPYPRFPKLRVYLFCFSNRMLIRCIGLRRHSSRTFPTNKSDTTIPNLQRIQQNVRTSAYPTPARSDISRDSRSHALGYTGGKISSAAKLESPSPSISPGPPIMYDTIEVMFAPPSSPQRCNCPKVPSETIPRTAPADGPREGSWTMMTERAPWK